MPIVLDGTNGITTPDVDSGPIIGTTGAFSGNVTANGLSTELRPLVLGTAQASTSGINIDFTGIPSWAKRVTVIFSGVSTNGTSPIQIQIGSGSFTTSGYSCAQAQIQGTNSTVAGTRTTGFPVAELVTAAGTFAGHVVLTNLTGNTWVESGNVLNTSAGWGTFSTGNITLAGVLDRIRITTANGTDTFDAGTINIMYE